MLTTGTADMCEQTGAPERFRALVEQYNYLNTPPHGPLFAELLLEELRLRSGARVLDVGCGHGIQRQPGLVADLRANSAEFWGVEPDSSVAHNTEVYSHFQHALLETADLPESYFDLVYSIMVMEHVKNPEAYFRAVHRVLKPGGVHMFCTPNGRHLFTILAKSLRIMRLDELILRFLRPGAHGTYHYPVFYRSNTPTRVNRLARSTGFLPPEYVFFESGGIQCYFRGPFRPMYWLLAARRRYGRRKDILVTLIARMTKATEQARLARANNG